jgi:DNA-binding MarR family transcriptional regulator
MNRASSPSRLDQNAAPLSLAPAPTPVTRDAVPAALRIPAPYDLPLRVQTRLWSGSPHAALDGIGKALYHAAMNDVHDAHSRPPAPAAAGDGGATLFSFLAAAEQLYEWIAEALARVGLSYAKYELLKHLQDSKEPVSLGTLAECQGCARSNITQLVDRLETEGLVRRVSDPGDRRAVRAELTPLGISQVEEGTTQMDLVRARFAASFSGPERTELARLLSRLP